MSGQTADEQGPARPEPRHQPSPEPRRRRDDPVEEASEESFPASDAPAWSPLHPGTPGEHPDERKPPR